MNNKKVKKLICCICASSLLLGAIPTNGIVASATDTTPEVEDGVTFSDAAGNELKDAKYSIHGVSYDNDEGIFVRMDLEAAANICNTDSVYDDNGEWVKSIYALARESSGGRIRFNTNSPTITIKAELFNWDAAHVSHGGKMEASKYGFDIYEDTADGSIYVDTVVAETKDEDGDGKVDPGSVYVNQTIDLGEVKERDLTIYLPVITETKNVEICIAEGSTVQEHKKAYEGNGMVVVYGNSITQGGSAVKPGSNYVNASMRNLNLDFLNLGMWGSCKGQATFAEYIANLENVSMLIMDYDGNENKASELSARHYPFYKAVREKYPDIPIVLLTRSGNRLQVNNTENSKISTTAELRAVIRETYDRAKAEGDKNVHYVDGETFFGFSYAYLADGVHPTQIGQDKMGDVLTVVLEEILAGAKNVCVEPSSCKEPTSILAKDFTGEKNGTAQPEGLKASKINVLEGTLDCGVITTENDNKAYQLKYTRGSSGAMATLAPANAIWNGETNLAVEMDVELHVTDGVIPQLGVKIGEEQNNSAHQKYEVRVQVAEKKQAIYIYDNTGGGSNSASELVVTDTFENKNFINMYQDGKVAFNLKITQTKVQHRGVDSLELNVYLDNILVSGYNLIPQEGFEPESFKIFCYGAGENGEGVNKAVVDNIKAYVTTTHQLSLVATEGMREHYVCSECGKKFLDANGILRMTDEDLTIKNECIETLFSDDFEGADNWTLSKNYTGTDTVGIVGVEDGHVYQMGVTRESNSKSTYIMKNAPALETENKYTMEFQETLYRGTLDDGTSAGNRWPSITCMMYDTSTKGYFDIRIIPKSGGFQTYLREKQGNDTFDHNTTDVTDSTLAISSSKTEVLYDIKIEVTTYEDDENHTRWQILLYVGNNDVVVFDFAPYYENIAINQLRFYTYPGSIKTTTHFKTQLDNIRVYTDSHTISPVAATPSTSDTPGVKAHYACEVCGKKFADSEGEQAVTDEELAYAKLSAILCQTRANETNAQNEDVRFVVYVDDYTKYQSVTFKITCSAGTGTAICKNVYTGVYADGQLYTAKDIYGVDGYFATFILRNNTPANLADTMTVVATWKALDGTETVTTRVVNISEEQK